MYRILLHVLHSRYLPLVGLSGVVYLSPQLYLSCLFTIYMDIILPAHPPSPQSRHPHPTPNPAQSENGCQQC